MYIKVSPKCTEKWVLNVNKNGVLNVHKSEF